ncbi:MAG: GNAT family N-acetyltransferase [Clostridia bacterium]|nr:GNAT family N-acetyltransferase [Clostridia bacterium]
MIVRQEPFKKEELYQLACKNLGVNYFILMGLSISNAVYKDVYYLYKGQSIPENLEAVLFKRQSGNLQLMCFVDACSSEVCQDFQDLIEATAFKKMITSQQYVRALQAEHLFTTKVDGAYVHAAKKVAISKDSFTSDIHIRPLTADDVDTIEALYKSVFDSFTPPHIMRDKLASRRGRGVGLFKDHQLIAVAQSDFETECGAIIVGVATHPDYQHCGYGHAIMSALCMQLMAEGKEMILHYDSPIAGQLYAKMGFHQIDRIVHYEK